MKFGSLFAGIGGFDLGLERAGMRCAWQVEISKHCSQALAHHWPDVKRYGDVKDVGKHNLESVDLICGGFPCQDLSVAGRRSGLAGGRSGLWYEFARIIEDLSPRWVIIENVPGLLSSNEGRDMGTIIGALGQFGYGYAYTVLDAQYFGVAQRRRRVFIVGCLGDGRSAAEVLFERESCERDSPPSREKGEEVADPITKSFAKHHGRSAGKDSQCRNHVVSLALTHHHQRLDPTEETLIPVGVDSELNADEDRIGAIRSHQSGGAELFVARPLAFGRTINHYDESQQTYVTGTLNSGGSGGGFRTEPGEHLVSPTIGADIARQAGGHPGIEEYTDAVSRSGFGVRRLTPIECERLQGFPDGFTAVDGMSDSARYRMLGNAVAVPVAEWIGKQLLERIQ